MQAPHKPSVDRPDVIKDLSERGLVKLPQADRSLEEAAIMYHVVMWPSVSDYRGGLEAKASIAIDTETHRLVINFQKGPFPPNQYFENSKFAIGYADTSQYQDYIDLLRNEKYPRVTFDWGTDPPVFVVSINNHIIPHL